MRINFKKKNQGFTLVEVLVAGGLLSIVTVAALNLWQLINESQTLVASLQDISSFETKLQRIISIESVCTLNFAGISLLPSVNNDIVTIKFSASENLYEKNAKNTEGKIIIESINLTSAFSINPRKAFGNLNVVMKDKKNLKYSRNIPIFAELNALGSITKCSSNSGSVVELSMLQSSCDIISEGTLYFDSTTQKCTPYVTVDFPGTRDTATCNTGYRIIECSFQGISYTPPPLNKSFAKGGSKNIAPSEAEGIPNETTNSCDCDYTNDLLAVSPGVICVAQCTQMAKPIY